RAQRTFSRKSSGNRFHWVLPGSTGFRWGQRVESCGTEWNLAEPSGTWRNRVEPGGTQWNLAEPNVRRDSSETPRGRRRAGESPFPTCASARCRTRDQDRHRTSTTPTVTALDRAVPVPILRSRQGRARVAQAAFPARAEAGSVRSRETGPAR